MRRWKTNSDRQNLLPGAFNLALLDRIVELAAESWSGLLDPEDPGRLLDLMTARAQDGKGWADEYLAKRLDERLAGMPSVPDLGGTLRNPSALTLRPAIVLRDEPAKWVDEHRGRERPDYCHPSVEQRERRARAARLGAPEGNLSTWLASVAAPATPAASIAAIELAGACLAHLPQNERYLVTNTAFILTEGGSLVTPMAQGFFLPPAGTGASARSSCTARSPPRRTPGPSWPSSGSRNPAHLPSCRDLSALSFCFYPTSLVGIDSGISFIAYLVRLC